MEYIISSGESSEGIILEKGGAMSILDGGVANSTTVNAVGSMSISSGGTAVETTVNSRGSICISSGGTAVETTVNSRGSICISSGGTAIGTDVGGYFVVSSGGTAIDTFIKYGVSFNISSGGTFEGIVFNGHNIKLTDKYGTTMNGVVLNSGSLILYSERYNQGPVVSGATVNSRAKLEVSSGCSVRNAVINSGGTMNVFRQGVLSNATVNSGGSLRIDRYGVAIGVVENGGCVNVPSSAEVFFLPNTISGLKLSNASATVHETTTASQTELGSGGRLTVFKNGKAIDTTINSGGSLTVSSGGSATAIVENGGYVNVLDDTEVSFVANTISGLVLTDASATVHSVTTATDVTINENAGINVFEGGKIDSATVNTGGRLTVSSGGSATAVAENGGYVFCEDGSEVSFASNMFSGLVLTGASATVHSVTTATDITISESGELDVFSGGRADLITLDGTSYLDVKSGGTATGIDAEEGAVLRFAVAPDGWIQGVSSGLAFEMKDAHLSGFTVISDGSLLVCDGGTAESITVDPGGYLSVSGGGTANGIVENGGYVELLDGATATFATNTFNGLLLDYASATVHSGTTATGTRIGYYGMLAVFDGGSVTETTISSGKLDISGSATAMGTTVNYGSFIVSESATAEETTVNGGTFNISGGATATGTTVNYGSFIVSESATAEETTMNGGSLNVSAGGTANETTMNGGSLSVYDGGTANDTVFNSGSLTAFGGAVLNGVTMNGGQLNISSRVVLNRTAVNSGGSLNVYDGGVLNSAAVNPLGRLYVNPGGTADNIVENGGYIDLADGAEATFAANTFSGLALSSASATVHSGTTATDTAISFGGRLDLFSGGTANKTTMNGGSLNVYDGGTANKTTMNGGSLNVYDGGTANDVNVNSNGSLNVYDGGTADNIVENGGYIDLADGAEATFAANTFSGLALSSTSATVHSGTTAIDLTVNAGGHINVCGGTANGAVVDGGYITVRDGTANDATVNNGYINVNGGTADGLTVNGGYINVNGGTADGLTVNGGYINVNGGTANDVNVNSNGSLYVHDEGTANKARVNSGGSLYVYSGGTATGIVENGGYVKINDGAIVSFSSNTFNGLVLADASATVHSGTTATDLKVKGGGYFIASEGGVANDATIVDGGYFEVNGGTANDVNVNSNGRLYVYDGGTADNIVENGGYVYCEDGAKATFTTNTFNGLVLSDASATVHSGTTATDLTVANGGSFEIFGGMANGVTLNSGGSIYVYNGGLTDAISIADGGYFRVFSGGTATNVTATGGASLNFEVTPNTLIQGTIDGKGFGLKDGVLSGYVMLNGSIGISSGGALNETTVGNNARLNIGSGALANGTTVENGAYLYLSPGGTANGIIVENGFVNVSSGAAVDGIAVNSGGRLYVYNGATANNIIENGGYVDIADGTEAFFTSNLFSGLTLSGTSATVHSGTTAADITVASGGCFAVFSGGTATGVTALEGAGLSFVVAPDTYIQGTYGDDTFEFKDALVSGYTVNAGGFLYVQSNGTVKETTVDNYGALIVSNGGKASGITVKTDGNFIVSNGGAAKEITLNNGGWGYVENGGTADNTTINSYGGLVISNGGIADGITVNAGGELYVSSGGTATSIVWTPCEGTVFIEEGASVSFVDNYSGVYCGSNDQLQFRVDSLGAQTVSSGSVVVMSGGTVNDITVERGGLLTVFSEGAANRTVLNSNGLLAVNSGGTANSISVNSDGILHISAGGTATAIIENGGNVYIEDGANVTFVSNTFSGLNLSRSNITLHSGTTALSCIIKQLTVSEGGVASAGGYGTAHIQNGGLLVDTELNSYNTIHISSGGTAAFTTIWDGSMFVSSGGMAVGNIFQTYRTGRLVILSGGIASNTLFQEYASNGELWVSSGGTAIRTSASYGSSYRNNRIRIFEGGVAIDTVVNKRLEFNLSTGATAIGTIIESGGRLDVRNNVLVESTTVTNGNLSLRSGGTATNTIVQSNGKFENGGTGVDVTVSSGGSLSIYSGGKLSGRIICNGGSITADSGATVDFDLTRTLPGSDARINDLSAIRGNYMLTLTIDEDAQQEGIYLLAEGAAEFNQTITVMNTAGVELDKLSLEDAITVAGTAYSLNLSDGALTLTVGVKITPPDGQHIGLVIENDSVQVESGELFLETQILSGGQMHVLSGGTADGIAVGPNGMLDVFSGGTARGIVADSGARLDFAVCDDTVIAGTSAGSSFEIENGVVSGYGIISGCLNILSGGTANDVAVSFGGELLVSSGGTATDIVWTPCVGSVSIEEGAYVTFADEYSGVYYGSADQLISHAAVLDTLPLGSGASAYVMSGGTASGMSVGTGGRLLVSSGGTAMDIVWTPCVGSVSIEEGAYVTFADEYSGVYFGSNDRLISRAAAIDGLSLKATARAYVMSDGTASGTVIGSSGNMYVFCGGIASDVSVNPGGHLSVNSGGLAKNARLFDDGELHVSSGGYALAVVISSGGRMSLASGGTAVGVYLMDSMRVSAGRIVGVMISSGGHLITDNGTLEYAIVCSGGGLNVGGGVTTSAIVSSGGSAVFSGGSADTVLVESSGFLKIVSTAIVSGIEISSGGRMIVSDGGSTCETLLSSGGTMTVASGGTTDSTTIMYGGNAYIDNGGVASGTLISSSGTMYLNGGTICDTEIRDGRLVLVSGTLTGYCNFTNGYFSVVDGAILNLDLTRTQPGFAAKVNKLPYISGDWSLTVTVDAGDQAEGVYLLADGVNEFDRTITVLGRDGTALGALACGETVTIGRTTYALSLSSSTLALQIGEDYTPSPYTSDGLVFGGSSRSVLSNAVFHDTTVLYGGTLIVTSGGTASNTTLAEEMARLTLSFGGIADGATVLSGGGIQVLRKGALNGATVSATGGIYIYDGGIAYDTRIMEDGNLRVYSGGAVSNVTVSSGGTLWLNAGGTATNITLASGACLECVLASGTYLTGTSGGSAFEIKAGAVSNVTLTSACLYVKSGGSVDTVSLNSGGSIRVLLNNIKNINIKDECFANNIIVNPGGKLYVMPYGSATVAFNPWSGDIIASRYASITYLNRDAKVYYGGSSSGLISKANVMDDLEILSGNSAIVYYNGLISNAQVDANGLLLVDADGNASDTVVRRNGEMRIVSGGMATNVRIESGGRLLCNEAILDGKVSIVFGGMLRVENSVENEEEEIEASFVSVCDGLVLDFDLTRTESEFGMPAMVNGLSAIIGTPIYTLTVGTKGKPGTHSYVLADGADGFKETLSVTNAAGDTLGTLAVGGETVFVDDVGYTLNLTGSLLSVTVDVPDLPPTVFDIVADITEPTNQDVTVTASFKDDVGIAEALYRIGEDGEWTVYESGVVLSENAIVYFKAVDTACNESEIVSYEVKNIDKVAPVITLSGDNTTPLQSSSLTASTEDGIDIFYSTDNQSWNKYEGEIPVAANATYYFKATDAAGNVGTAKYVFANIDTVPPVLMLSGDNETMLQASTLTATVDDDSEIFYSLDNVTWAKYEGMITVDANATYYFKAVDAAGNSSTAEYVFANILPKTEVVMQTQTWEAAGQSGEVGEETLYIVEYSTDNFEHVIQMVVDSNSLDSFQMPAGTYQWRVKSEDADDWSVGQTFVAAAESDTPKVVQSNEDGNDDLFFATASGTWENIYYAQNVGSVNDWTGTNEIISANGKGRIQNLFFGSTDPNVLCLTDGENGDAIFVDDVYTELPDSVAEHTARLYKIQEVRAGAGDDIVDMTSQRFEYIGEGLTIRGGDGNDTIWATKGNNFLFGDAGNDRIVGASGNDAIVGGIGNDRMHGGGGDDIFTFCDNWGTDTVEQLAGGKVTLWFASGDESKWNAETLTYTDGDNSVKVTGVSEVTLKFGDNTTEQYATLAQADAFLDFTSERIFEETGKGVLASL